jgi:hypothetical protein
MWVSLLLAFSVHFSCFVLTSPIKFVNFKKCFQDHLTFFVLLISAANFQDFSDFSLEKFQEFSDLFSFVLVGSSVYYLQVQRDLENSFENKEFNRACKTGDLSYMPAFQDTSIFG